MHAARTAPGRQDRPAPEERSADRERFAEQRLVRAAAAGDRPAFADLYRAHHRRVHALALRMVRCPELAEDVTQDAFVTAWSRLGSFRGGSRFGTWICGIAVRTALHALRSERRRRARLERSSREARESALVDAFGAPLELDVERAVGDLPDRARATLLLHTAGLDHAAIATAMGVTPGTVKSQLHRARRLVLEALSR